MIACPACGGTVALRESHVVMWCLCGRLSVYEREDDAPASRWYWSFEWSRHGVRDIKPGYGLSEEQVRTYCDAAVQEQVVQDVLES